MFEATWLYQFIITVAQQVASDLILFFIVCPLTRHTEDINDISISLYDLWIIYVYIIHIWGANIVSEQASNAHVGTKPWQHG